MLAETTPGRLAFDAVVPGTVTVRSTYKADEHKRMVYKEGEDYVVGLIQGTLARTENSKKSDFAKNVLHGQKDFDHGKFPGVHEPSLLRAGRLHRPRMGSPGPWPMTRPLSHQDPRQA